MGERRRARRAPGWPAPGSGTSASPVGRPGLALGSSWSSGSPKARVLPEPVLAFPHTSRPARMSGMVISWMAKAVSMPRSARAWQMSSVQRRGMSKVVVMSSVALSMIGPEYRSPASRGRNQHGLARATARSAQRPGLRGHAGARASLPRAAVDPAGPLATPRRHRAGGEGRLDHQAGHCLGRAAGGRGGRGRPGRPPGPAGVHGARTCCATPAGWTSTTDRVLCARPAPVGSTRTPATRCSPTTWTRPPGIGFADYLAEGVLARSEWTPASCAARRPRTCTPTSRTCWCLMAETAEPRRAARGRPAAAAAFGRRSRSWPACCPAGARQRPLRLGLRAGAAGHQVAALDRGDRRARATLRALRGRRDPAVGRPGTTGIGCVALSDREFGEWAVRAWPPFSDGVRAAARAALT